VGECVKGEEIPLTDHVALHCQPQHLEVGPDGKWSGLSVDAFDVDDDGISVNWVEHDCGSGPFGECFERTCCTFARVRTLRRSHACGILRVADIIQTAAACGRSVSVVHDPVEEPVPNPAHSLIRGCVPGDDLLHQFALLAELHQFPQAALEIAKKREKERK
jgi:hypothetical protein